MPLHYPSFLQWYKKPDYVDVKAFSYQKAHPNSAPASPRSSIDSRRDIPSKLSLEKILKNETCSPMSLYDFHMYLKHIEHSPENLEFFVWYKNYEAGRLTGVLNHSPPASSHHGSISKHDEKIFEMAAAESQEDLNSNHTDMYAQISSLVDRGCQDRCAPKTNSIVQGFRNVFDGQSESTDSAGVEVACQNLSDLVSDQEILRKAELEKIRTMFLLPGSPKELNIPSTMRQKVLEDISNSTSAANLKPVADHIYILLKSCSHRNFIRLGVQNGTFETICMATGLGIVLTVTGLLAMLLLAFASPSIHHCSRWKGLGIWPMWAVGVSLILSGLRGSCFFLLLFSRRQPLPWEKFDDDASLLSKRTGLMSFFGKLMIFDRKVKVKDDNLRLLQRKIVMQSVSFGMLFATLMEIFFLALPIWKPIH